MNKHEHCGRYVDLVLFIVAVIVVIGLTAGLARAAEPVTEGAVFKLSSERIDTIRQECGNAADFFTCYVTAFQKAGAPAGAVDFIRKVGEPGFMTDFKKVGPVDVAFADFPFRANENRGCFLVNGDPEIVNVDDLSAITGAVLDKNKTYRGLKKKYPEIGLWMGDRQGTNFITVSKRKGGAVRFSVPYRLTESCRACTDVGQAIIGFDFNAKGRFTGQSVVTVKAVKDNGKKGK